MVRIPCRTFVRTVSQVSWRPTSALKILSRCLAPPSGLANAVFRWREWPVRNWKLLRKTRLNVLASSSSTRKCSYVHPVGGSPRSALRTVHQKISGPVEQERPDGTSTLPLVCPSELAEGALIASPGRVASFLGLLSLLPSELCGTPLQLASRLSGRLQLEV